MDTDKRSLADGVKKIRDFHSMKPGAEFVQTEFGFYVLDRWKSEGYINDETDLDLLFGYDKKGIHPVSGLGWTTAEFDPYFKTKIIEDKDRYEIIQDEAGRHLKCFKGRRSGFMPEYIDNPVKDRRSWEERCKWRLDPYSQGREKDMQENISKAQAAAAKGMMVSQRLIGGYMYLRSLIGPVELLYMVYDDPELIHDCMQTWFVLADKVIERHQQYFTIDELFIGEDICYNHGLLISPDMVLEFLFPYYRQLLENIKKRQLDKDRHLYFQLDTDGFSDPAIELYGKLGMDRLSPFEVASGCDVVRTRKEYPYLLISGGFDKRILSKGPEAIDREIDRIMPFMKDKGGYIPTCDHGVPEEVSFENYMHYRTRMRDY